MSALRRDLRAICAEGAASSVMVGTGETYLPAFVLALTSSQLACGLVGSVPLIAGALLQLASPYAIGWLRSYRRWTVLCAIVQAASLLPLCLVATTESLPIVLVFVLASVYWGAGMAGSPAWNAWVGILIPRRLRTGFFAHRTRLSQLGLLVGFLTGGAALQMGASLDLSLVAFAFLFMAAALSRLISAFYLSRQQDRRSSGREFLSLRVPGLLRSLRQDANGMLLLYLLAAQMAVQISGPYFNPYMLGQLKLSYLQYVLLTSAAYVAKIVFLPTLGRLADRWSTTRLLWTSGLGITPLPALWMISDNLGYLFLLQVYSGAVWAGFDLAMLLLLFETIPAPKRIAILTIFNLANATAIVLGSLIGGAILTALGIYREVYLIIFLVSSIARATALLVLARMPQVKVATVAIPTRPLALRPALGSMDRPILAGLGRRPDRSRRPVAAQTAAGPLVVRTPHQRKELTVGALGRVEPEPPMAEAGSLFEEED